MPSINGLTNPFENSILNSNLTQLEKEKQIANYSSAIGQGYEPPVAVLDEIASILEADVLSPEAEARLQSLLDQIIGEIGPIITSNDGGDSASVTVDENSSVVTTVVALDRYSLNNGTEALSYSIVGGADAGLFQINATTGVLTFIAPPDYEAPVGGDNIYDVVVQVNDGAVLVDTQALQITVADLNDTAPVIVSNSGGTIAAVAIDENTTAVTTVQATDADTVGTVSYAITGGADAALFSLNATTGALEFLSAPDHEAPGDHGGDNVYDVTVEASDGVQSANQTLSITVNNVNEAPVATAGSATGDEDTILLGSAVATDVDGDTLTYSVLSGPANGAVVMQADGNYAYTPIADFNGSDSFVFLVDDGLGGMDSAAITLTVDAVPDGFSVNTAYTPIAVSYLRGLSYDPGHAGNSFQNFGGVAFDSVSGRVYESAGIHRYNENYVRVYDDAANFEAGTYSSTLNLGNQIDINYPSDITGTYFAAYDGQLIGRSSLYGSDYSPYSAHAWDVGFWNASTGAMNSELTVNPNADFTGLNYGGYNAMNVMSDGDNIYSLSRYASSSTWQLAELDPNTNSVIGTENLSLGSVGFAFVVEDFLFIGSTYGSGVVSRAYDIENNTMHGVNLQFSVPSNIYWSNTSYDSNTDSLYFVSSPNTSTLGELYEVENVSDFLFA